MLKFGDKCLISLYLCSRLHVGLSDFSKKTPLGPCGEAKVAKLGLSGRLAGLGL